MKQRTIEELAAETLTELEKQHYAKRSLQHFKHVFTRLEKHAAEVKESFLSDS